MGSYWLETERQNKQPTFQETGCKTGLSKARLPREARVQEEEEEACISQKANLH